MHNPSIKIIPKKPKTFINPIDKIQKCQPGSVKKTSNTPRAHPTSTAVSGRMRTAEARGGQKRGGGQHREGEANVRVGTKGESAETRRAGDARRPFSRTRVANRAPPSPAAPPMRPHDKLPPLGWCACVRSWTYAMLWRLPVAFQRIDLYLFDGRCFIC